MQSLIERLEAIDRMKLSPVVAATISDAIAALKASPGWHDRQTEQELNTVDEIIEVMQAVKAGKPIERLNIVGEWQLWPYITPNFDFTKFKFRVLDENRKKVQRMVDVMLAYGRGEKIEYKFRQDGDWNQATTPCWNWDSCDYRVQPK